VQEGEALLGAYGAEKSTILRILATLLKRRAHGIQRVSHGIQLSYQLQPMAGDKSLPARSDLSMLVSYWTLERTKSSGTLSHR
jgi:ABC-type Na+ transport system ATPase subunit NatA